jgi:hypothetical protein
MESTRPRGAQHSQPSILSAAARALHSKPDRGKRGRSPSLSNVEAGHGPGVTAISALDPKRALEAGKIGGGADVLCGHSSRLRP